MFSAREALRTSAFWLISLGHGFSLLVVSAVNVHAITHMKEGLGYSLAQATLVFTLVTVGPVPRRDARLGDRREVREAQGRRGLHADARRRPAHAHLRDRLRHPDRLPRWCTARPGACAARSCRRSAPTTSAARSIGMIMGLSSLITVFGQIGGPMLAGCVRRLDRRLPRGLHDPGGAGRSGVVVLLGGAAAAVTSVTGSRPSPG